MLVLRKPFIDLLHLGLCLVKWFNMSWVFSGLFFDLLLCIAEIAVMGKVEGQGESWHGHVTAVTVAPEYRRQQLAKKLMNLLEDISDKM